MRDSNIKTPVKEKHVTIPFFIPHMGCSHDCIFCNQRSITGKNNSASPADVNRLVREYRKTIPDNTNVEIGFFGGSFTALPDATQREFLYEASLCISQGLADQIRLSTRPDAIDEKACDILDQYGVRTVELGAQSFDDDVLKASHRGHSSDDTLKALSVLSRRGVDIVLQLMAGLPGENKSSCNRSAETAAAHSIQGARIYPVVVFAGTQLETLFREGSYTPLALENAVELCAQMSSCFQKKNIPVIRTGIHTLDLSQADDIVAGPYHPSFGFLVKSRIRRNELETIADDFLSSRNGNAVPSLLIPEESAEEYIGYKRENILWLAGILGVSAIDYTISEDIRCPAIHCTG
jgi:histone acetyltransferase (RNA polymerase elongator complex component)